MTQCQKNNYYMSWLAFNRVCGGTLLVSGTCIGAGMLGLPITTAAGGFYPATGAFVLCWGLMTLTAFLMLEISLCYPEQTNLITMAKATLGRFGELFAWVCYLLFLYSLMAAYTSGASGILDSFLVNFDFPATTGLWGFVVFFGFVVYLGARWVDGVNRLVMIGLVLAYGGLIILVFPKVNLEMVNHGEPKYLWMAGPLLVTSFGFHLLIPSLKNYLHTRVNELRWSIFIGSLLPLLIYLCWEFMILGAVPVRGEKGLIAMNQVAQPVVVLTQTLSENLSHPSIRVFAKIFSFCAILTSFIGVSLGLFDFLADGFHISKTKTGKGVLATLTFVPPALFAKYFPAGFLLALRYAGIFAAILLVLYPAVMVWRHRYHLKLSSEYQVFGGKPALILAIFFGVGMIGLEILQELHQLPVPTL